MKFLKVLGIIILALAVIIIVGSFFLPKTYTVTRTAVIKAPDSTIYKNIADFNEFLKWNPWAKMEPTAKTTISGPIAQPNHLYEWVGKETGSGQMKILKVIPNGLVDIELKFIKPFESVANTKFNIVPADGGYEVIWTMSGDNDGILSKWMCVLMNMDKMVGNDFESGLASLKEKSEKQ